jgi:microcystin degradation protein MlrC
MYRELPYDEVAPEVRRARSLAAAALRGAGAALDALARRLTHVEPHADAAEPLLEYHACHAEAGAPEGALYVNGLLVGRLAEVNRL